MARRKANTNSARLVVGDCLDVLPALTPASVDAVITDPPYGIGKAGWDGFFPRDWFPLARRAAKPDALFVILTNPGEALRDAIDLLGPLYRTTFAAWICNGMTRGPISFGNWIAVTIGTASPKWRPIQDVVRVAIKPSEKVEGHPSPKPLGLMREVVTRLTSPGDLILDPFAGSATTLLAARLEGRDSIGIERDPAYHALGLARLNATLPPEGGSDADADAE